MSDRQQCVLFGDDIRQLCSGDGVRQQSDRRHHLKQQRVGSFHSVSLPAFHGGGRQRIRLWWRDRYASNIFLDGAGTLGSTGLSAYRGYPSTMAEYLQSVHDIFASGVTNGHDPQPVQMLYSWDNAYVGEAEGPEGEQGTTHVASPVNVRCEFKGDDLYLLFDCPTELADKKAAVVGTADLGVPRIVDERYEETDGSDIVIDTDIVGRQRAELSSVGPFAELHPGSNRQLVWCGASGRRTTPAPPVASRNGETMKITNPVLTGFHADPSMIRVKDTYYIANSTFEWFPGIRLHESKDMVHWNTLPYPLAPNSLTCAAIRRPAAYGRPTCPMRTEGSGSSIPMFISSTARSRTSSTT